MSDIDSELIARNITSFIKRPLMLYSFGDIKLKNPIAFKRMAHYMLFFIVWTIPVVMVIGIPLSFFKAILAFAPPLVLGNISSRPVFGGKEMFAYVGCTLKFYFSEPKGWTDLNNSHATEGKEHLFVNQEIWVSRRRELKVLAAMGLEEEAAKTLRESKRKRNVRREKAAMAHLAKAQSLLDQWEDDATANMSEKEKAALGGGATKAKKKPRTVRGKNQ